MSDAARRTGPALEAMYRFVLWLIPAVEKFPRSQKFLLGLEIHAFASRRHCEPQAKQSSRSAASPRGHGARISAASPEKPTRGATGLLRLRLAMTGHGQVAMDS
jgi:hypothetical protein